jgi:hypothetical protein
MTLGGEMKKGISTNDTVESTSDNVETARAAYEAASIDFDQKANRYQEASAELRRIVGLRDVDFLDHRAPVEAKSIELQIAVCEAEDKKAFTRQEYAAALDDKARVDGCVHMQNMTSLVPDLRARAAQMQQGGDSAGQLRAVDARLVSYEDSYRALAREREAKGQPSPLRIRSAYYWRALEEEARSATAGTALSAEAVFRAAFGGPYGGLYQKPPLGMSGSEAIEFFAQPLAPRPHTERLLRLRAELEKLHGQAFDEFERRKAAALDAERERKQAEGARRHAREADAQRAQERAQESAAREKAMQERRAQIAAFVEGRLT